MGLKPVTISVDNYFVERINTPKDSKGEYDFEALDAVDRKLLNNDIIKLLKGEEIDAPIFDFIEGKKVFGKNKAHHQRIGDVPCCRLKIPGILQKN